MTEREHAEEYRQLEQAIAALEAQRVILDEAVVEAALGPMRRQLAELKHAEHKPDLAFEGERKLVTVMFADFPGFTALAEKLDPEAVRELVNACFYRLVPVIEKREGTVEKFIGDEIMAIFGAPVVLVSGCHYIDANRSTMRRLDGLWDGLEKAGLRSDRLQLEWCSAAEGACWQTIMREAENKRRSVTQDEIEQSRSVLVEAKVPSPRNLRPSDEGQEATFVCMHCGNEWNVKFEVNTERICPSCRSNSIRWLRVQ